MSIIRFNPYSFNPFGFEEDWSELTMTQGINVYEQDDKVTVEAPMPGVAEQDIHVEYEDGILRLSGRHEVNEEDKKKRMYHRMQKISSFSYSTTLPKTIDVNSIEASIKNGVVVVEARVAEEVKPRKITVKAIEK